MALPSLEQFLNDHISLLRTARVPGTTVQGQKKPPLWVALPCGVYPSVSLHMPIPNPQYGDQQSVPALARITYSILQLATRLRTENSPRRLSRLKCVIFDNLS